MTNPDDVTASPMVVLPLAEAASRLGLSVAALRSRIRRGVVTAKRGNDGRLLVEIPADARGGHDVATTSPDATVAELQGEIGELRELLARAEAERDAAESVAEAQVGAAKAQAAAVRELCDRLTAELADARKPWWRRWVGSGRH